MYGGRRLSSLAENRRCGSARGRWHRQTALGHTGGNGSSKIVPSEMKAQASRQLAGQESDLEDAAHGGGEVLKCRPQGAGLSSIQHALPISATFRVRFSSDE